MSDSRVITSIVTGTWDLQFKVGSEP